MTFIGQRIQVSDHTKEFQRGHWSFLGPGKEEWYGTYAHKPEGRWDQEANQMIDQFVQSGHSMFRGTIEAKIRKKLFTSRRT